MNVLSCWSIWWAILLYGYCGVAYICLSPEKSPLVKELQQKHDRPHLATMSSCYPSVSLLWGQTISPVLPNTQVHMVMHYHLALFVCLATESKRVLGDYFQSVKTPMKTSVCVLFMMSLIRLQYLCVVLFRKLQAKVHTQPCRSDYTRWVIMVFLQWYNYVFL